MGPRLREAVAETLVELAKLTGEGGAAQGGGTGAAVEGEAVATSSKAEAPPIAGAINGSGDGSDNAGGGSQIESRPRPAEGEELYD